MTSLRFEFVVIFTVSSLFFWLYARYVYTHICLGFVTQVLLESNRSQALTWIKNDSNAICKVFGPGLVVQRHFTAFIVIRPSHLMKAMTILSASKLLSFDDLIEFRSPLCYLFFWFLVDTMGCDLRFDFSGISTESVSEAAYRSTKCAQL